MPMLVGYEDMMPAPETLLYVCTSLKGNRSAGPHDTQWGDPKAAPILRDLYKYK